MGTWLISSIARKTKDKTRPILKTKKSPQKSPKSKKSAKVLTFTGIPSEAQLRQEESERAFDNSRTHILTQFRTDPALMFAQSRAMSPNIAGRPLPSLPPSENRPYWTLQEGRTAHDRHNFPQQGALISNRPMSDIYKDNRLMRDVQKAQGGRVSSSRFYLGEMPIVRYPYSPGIRHISQNSRQTASHPHRPRNTDVLHQYSI